MAGQKQIEEPVLIRVHQRLVFSLGLLAALALSAEDAEKLRLEREALYTGMADASGAIVVSTNLFVVACDEDNILRVYSRDRPGPPLKQFDCDAFLELIGKSTEADLEAAARVGDRGYWMGSHGRNKNGKFRPNRGRFFATSIQEANGEVTLTPMGKPCKTLLDDLIRDSRFDRFHFAAAASLAPKERNALNIEGLSATPNGQLLIGFRNPVPEGKALLIPLLNPDEVISGKPARFGAAILLDLGGLGIRDIALYQQTYFIIAGSWHGGGPFQLYRWAGPGTRPQPLTVKHLDRYQPEGIAIYPDKGLREVQILSDDGKRVVRGVSQRAVPVAARTFRSFWVVGREGDDE